MSTGGRNIVHDFFISRKVMAKLSLFVGIGEKFFFLSGLSFTTIHEPQDSRGRRRAFFFFNSSLPLPPASQALRH